MDFKNKIALYKGHMLYNIHSTSISHARIEFYTFHEIGGDFLKWKFDFGDKTETIHDYNLIVDFKDVEIRDFYEFEDTLKIVSHFKGKIICESQTNGLIYKITSGEIDRLYNLGKVVDQKIHGKWKFKNDTTYGTWSVQLIA